MGTSNLGVSSETSPRIAFTSSAFVILFTGLWEERPCSDVASSGKQLSNVPFCHRIDTWLLCRGSPLLCGPFHIGSTSAGPWNETADGSAVDPSSVSGGSC